MCMYCSFLGCVFVQFALTFIHTVMCECLCIYIQEKWLERGKKPTSNKLDGLNWAQASMGTPLQNPKGWLGTDYPAERVLRVNAY